MEIDSLLCKISALVSLLSSLEKKVCFWNYAKLSIYGFSKKENGKIQKISDKIRYAFIDSQRGNSGVAAAQRQT